MKDTLLKVLSGIVGAVAVFFLIVLLTAWI